MTVRASCLQPPSPGAVIKQRALPGTLWLFRWSEVDDKGTSNAHTSILGFSDSHGTKLPKR